MTNDPTGQRAVLECRSKLKAQGAVMAGEGAASQIADTLHWTVHIATPGMPLYHTDEPGVYEIPLGLELAKYPDSVIKESLQKIDKRIMFLRSKTTWRSHSVYIRIDDAKRRTEHE